MTVWLARRTSDSQERAEGTQRELRGKLDQSLLNEQYSKGQLDSLALTVGNLGQPNSQNGALASAIRQMAQANAQKVEDLKASNLELCDRAHSEAKKIRDFQDKFERERSQTEESSRMAMMRLQTDAERQEIWRKAMQDEMQASTVHDVRFREDYVAESKYLRDLLVDRLPPKTRDMIVGNNGQAENNLSVGRMAGAFNEYGIANYLDELAKGLCQSK